MNNGADTPLDREDPPFYTVSHLRYLLARNLAHRAENLEMRLLTAIRNGGSSIKVEEIYQRMKDLLAEGEESFEEFLTKLEQASSLPIAARKEQLQPVHPQGVFREESDSASLPMKSY